MAPKKPPEYVCPDCDGEGTRFEEKASDKLESRGPFKGKRITEYVRVTCKTCSGTGKIGR